MPYEVPPLPYAYEALEPVIDAETTRLHHDKHHQAYVDAVNKALADQPDLQGKTIEELLRGLDTVPEGIRATVRNNGGGHANHQLFWKIMAPPGQGGGGRPAGALADQVARDFGSFESMKEAFEAAAAKHFGSGWVFLVGGVSPNPRKFRPSQIQPRRGRIQVYDLRTAAKGVCCGRARARRRPRRSRRSRRDYLSSKSGGEDFPYNPYFRESSL